MLSLALNTLRYRKAAFAGAFVALFCAAAMVCACGMLLDTGLRGTVKPERYAGAPIVVAGDPETRFQKRKVKGDEVKTKVKSKPNTARAWIPAELAERLRGVPGVRSVVTEVSFPVPGTGAEGHGWESAALTPFTLRAGRAPVADGEIVVDAGGPGVGARVGSYRVVGVTRERLEHQRVVFLSTGEARRLAVRAGKVNAVGVWPAGAEGAVREAVRGSGAVVQVGDGRGRVEFLGADGARARLVSMGAALGGTSLIVALLSVVGTFGLAMQQRERELALLRAVAMTPRQLRKMIGSEALVLGLAAAVPGALAGMLLGGWLHGAFTALGAIPANLPLSVGVFPPVVAVAATVPAAWLAARVAARRVARLRPVEALGEASGAVTRVPWARVAGGVVALAVGAVLTGVLASVRTDAAAGPLTPLTALAWTTAVTLLGPVLARVVLGPPALALAPLPGTGGLASLNLRAGARRLAPVVAPLTLMIALSSTLLFAETTLTGAGERQAREGTLATHVIGPGVPGRAAEAVRRVPGVRAATEVLHTRVRAINSPYGVQGVTAEGLDATMDLGVTSGSLAELGNGTMAAREGIGMKVGDRVSFSMADGTPVTLRVVAVYRRGLGFGDLTLPHALVAAHVDAPLSTVLVAAPGVSRDALAAAAGAPVRDRAAAVERRDGGAVNRLALGLIVAFAAITMVNTLAMAVAGRSRELALLRLVGATRRQVLRMVRLETLVVVLVAAVLGTLVALVTLVAYSSGMTGTATPHVPVLGYLGIVGGAGLLALLAAALPARAALRSAPVEGLGVRE